MSSNFSYWHHKLITAVLLDENKKLVSFGYDAENQFSDLLTEDKHQDYFYFHQFKMLLHNKVCLLKLLPKCAMVMSQNTILFKI
jgi:hypothetical protein